VTAWEEVKDLRWTTIDKVRVGLVLTKQKNKPRDLPLIKVKP
jgi:hypothetical protein